MLRHAEYKLLDGRGAQEPGQAEGTVCADTDGSLISLNFPTDVFILRKIT